LKECGQVRVAVRVSEQQHADPRNPLALLRTRSERPYRRTAENRDELASLHASSGEDHGKT
jgi:hypothetical protein